MVLGIHLTGTWRKAFIAQSTDMIVLWDDTVFERLWCNYELAVHAKTSASSCAFKLVPIWEPAWNLAWLASWFAFGCSIDPSQRQLLAWDPSSEWSLFGSFWKTYYVSPVPFLVASVPCTWLCLQRFKHHKLMLDQMSHFELRDAKCTLETDRILIMEQILGLFDEALEPPVSVSFETTDSAGTTEQHSAQTEEDHPLISPSDIEEIRGITSYPTKEEIMDLFNAYVRGPLRDTVVRSTGRGDHVPFTLCIGACLPVFFTALATVFDCDGLGDCHRAAAHCGYPSVSRYMLGNVVIDLFLQQLFWGICCPLVVRTNGLATRVVSGHWSQMLLGSLLCAGLLYLTCCLSLVECGMVVVLFAKNSLLCLFGSTVGLMLLLVVYWRLFPCPEIWRSVIRQMR